MTTDTQVSFIPEAEQVLGILKRAREKQTDALYSLLLDTIREAAEDYCNHLHITWLATPSHKDKDLILDKDGGRVRSTQFVRVYDVCRFDLKELAQRLVEDGFELKFHEYEDLGEMISTISWKESNT